MKQLIGKIKRRLSPKARPTDSKLIPQSSFSQCGEDVLLKFICEQILRIPIDSYLDIGANHPFWLNNTAIFHLQGIRGVSIDPSETSRELFEKYRPTEEFMRIAVGARSLDNATVYVMDADTLTTLNKEEAELYVKERGHQIVRTETISVKSLDDIIDERFGGRGPTILSMDIEGYEREVLDAFSFGVRSPKVICLETINYVSQQQDTELKALLCDRGYQIHASTPINTIFGLQSNR